MTDYNLKTLEFSKEDVRKIMLQKTCLRDLPVEEADILFEEFWSNLSPEIHQNLNEFMQGQAFSRVKLGPLGIAIEDIQRNRKIAKIKDPIDPFWLFYQLAEYVKYKSYYSISSLWGRY